MRIHGHEHEHEHGLGHGRQFGSHHGGPGPEGFERWGGGRRGPDGDDRRRMAFGPFGPGFGPGGPWGGRGRGGGRGRARRGDVRASILALLADRSMHGYEMIQEIAERSGGAWKPSPGSVYPTLQLLEDEGLIASESSGGKKLFALTEEGRTVAEAGSDAPWEEVGRGVDWESVNEIRQAGAGLMEAFGQVWKTGTKEQQEKALAVVNDARKRLYLILADED
ncbi:MULTISPECIES: PadR family transcriptional regulator [Streptomyces]|uniref:PadR family transcriptional regulator n=1 Tax=Streptomyces koyangensis TaxID=188770 RepID=A0A385DIK8_9ACTN|nr:PadR family transcriptional regulator [Streptomyces koyangensis]AXQ58322.1 PadR family transcriptional regulator [Streptomyces koyangensis]WTD01577.1 PadR family transcriptional regulator [Streptomyces albidoflavus]